MANLLYETWVDFAEMHSPGEEHRWFFDPIDWDASNYIIQATATPLPIPLEETYASFYENQVEVTRVFFLRKGGEVPGGIPECQVNIWVKNTGIGIAQYRLNVALVSSL
jgi:hypothetical protein